MIDIDPAFRLHLDPRLLARRADRGFDVVGKSETEKLAALLASRRRAGKPFQSAISIAQSMFSS